MPFLITYVPYLYMFVQLLAAEIVFLIKTQRRNMFWLKMPLSALAAAVSSYFLVYARDLGFWIYLIPFALSAAVVGLSWDVNPLHALVFAVIAYSLQNCSFDIAVVVLGLFGMPDMQIVEIASLVVLALLLVACWFLFIRKGRITDVLGIHNLKLVIVGVVVLAAVVVLHAQFNYRTAETIGRVFLILCNALSLFLIFGISGRESLAREKAEIERMLRREETLHRISKENIDLINMKCHDLKHTLRAGRAALTESEMQEIEAAIAMYDSFVKTGNADLDIVIAEKSMRCRGNGITISCIADGAALAFMTPGDIYALFGNALDNAIEYLEHADPDKRVIDLSVRAKDDMVGICVENYCGAAGPIEDGLPVTSKRDKSYHGFGMKSMRYIAEKYGGRLVASCDDGKFVLSVIFPSRYTASRVKSA